MICKMCGEKEAASHVEGFPDLCHDCAAESVADAKKIAEFRQQGHTSHCAARLVCGDGECTCGKKGRSEEERMDGLIEAVKENLK